RLLHPGPRNRRHRTCRARHRQGASGRPFPFPQPPLGVDAFLNLLRLSYSIRTVCYYALLKEEESLLLFIAQRSLGCLGGNRKAVASVSSWTKYSFFFTASVPSPTASVRPC
ncbi:unnamed protein product, partial [Phaeothamnion confervicola]